LQASVIRAALPCLSHVLAALDPADWPSATQPFTLLLRFCIDARPKVRRRAQGGLVDVLAAVQRTTAIDNASALVLKGDIPFSTDTHTSTHTIGQSGISTCPTQ